MRRLRPSAAALLALLAVLLPAGPAAARVGFFFGFPLGFYAPPPVYAPPPYYYVPPAPPPAYYYPPYPYVPPAPAPSTLSCHAGAWTCPLERPAQPGDACSCATARGPAWGRAGY